MNWNVIIGLSFLGVIMGALSIFGITQNNEPYLWIIIAIVCAFVIARTVNTKVAWHAIFVGLLIGLLHGVVQSIFFEMYTLNNPSTLEIGITQQATSEFPIFSSPLFIVLKSPFIGIIYGLLIAFLSIILKGLFTIGKQ